MTQWQQISQIGGKQGYIDLSGNTQMVDDERGTLVLHGYSFIDDKPADAETLLGALIVADSLDSFYARLSGQYWMAIQLSNQPLTLLGDHIGATPCYYHVDDGKVFVSSSLKHIKAREDVSVEINKQALYNYIYFHCIPAPTTIYLNSYKLEPGKAVHIEAGQPRAELLYSPEFSTALADKPAALKQCLDTIEHAVDSHATGQVGAFLSGGLDSSTVAGMLAKNQPQQARTFSIGFEVEGYDETEYALLTAKHFNTDHKVLYLKPEEAEKEFVKVAQYFDEPFGNSSAMAAYFCATFAKNAGIEVLLAGDGGDELFAGNERYAKQKVFEHYNRLPSALGDISNILFNNGLTRKIPGLQKVASYLNQARVPLPARLQTHNFVNQLGVENIFPAAFLAQVDTHVPEQQLKQRFDECKSKHPVDGMLYLDWKFTLADNDLVKVNKMCELAGVEVRFPLLDKQLVDFSCTIPADEKLPGGELRDFYKKSCKGFLADETLSKSKHGFGLPFGVWMKENAALKELTITTLNQFKQRNIVNASLIEQAMDAHNSVHTGYFGELIWIMVVLELWLQKEAADFSA
ncbi:asparagine synthase-related protein [Aliiglaciecola sp. LCG003]|uniref:asparagine synthetase B family protein n=1 Tax=Aliiglaciecola sp. LCG003 TaxID=3053655 RepID=UPI002573BB92|nr:asparagine synthase-related protein [Aliiglaciecola sp. LCG003]WJG10456.1 asparagine synthase-related protein [Aliiglaciecola sp. LCG003]